MAQRKKRAPRAPQHPGGPGAMAALKRAQEKLKAMGVKLYKHSPPDPKAGKKGAPPAPVDIDSPKAGGAKSAPATAPARAKAPGRAPAAKAAKKR